MKVWSRVVMAAAGTLALSAIAVSAAPSPSPGPSRPSSLKATALDTRVSLTWVAPTLGKPITYYTVKGSPGGISYQTPDGTTTAYTVTNLTNGTAYTFTVTATNSNGTGPASLPATATPRAVPPDRPQNLSATQGPGAGQITLAWTPPASNGSMPDGSNAAITRYNITVSPGAVSDQVPATTTTYTASNLADNVTYTFTVSATNTRPLTGAAAVVYAPLPTGATIGLQPTAGGASTAITATGQSFLKNEAITLYWDDPSHVAAAVVTDGNGAFTKVVKPFAGDKPKVHKLCASVPPKPCASFTLQGPPTPTPKATPTPVESPSPSPSPSNSPRVSATRPSGGISGLEILTRPPFVFLPIIGIIGLLGVIAYWVLSSRRRPVAPTSARVVHLATRPDYMAPFPQSPATPPITPSSAAPEPPASLQAPPPPPLQPPAQPPLPAAGPPAPEWPQTPSPAPTPPPPPPTWPSTPDEPPDLPQPSD